MSRALVLGSLVALVGALVSLVWLPNRAEPDEKELRRIAELEVGSERLHADGALSVEPQSGTSSR
jgi:hypothetical protein